MRILAAAAIWWSFQAGSLDDFYKFKAGTTWTYKKLDNGEEHKIVARSLGLDSGIVRVDWKEFARSGAIHTETEIAWTVDKAGILIAASKSKGAPDNEAVRFAMLKEGAK